MLVSFCIIFIILFYIYIGYPCLLFVLNFFIAKPVNKGEVKLSCSLIVTAFNEEKYIKEKILNSLALNYPVDKLEIIIALDGCTDNTLAIAKPYEECGDIIIINEKHLGKTAVQFKAVKKSKGEILIFSDTNAVLEKNAIKNMMMNYEDASVGCVCGDLNYICNDGTSGEGLYKKYENFIKRLESNTGSIVSVEGSLFSVRREYYAEDWEVGGEDAILPFRVAEDQKRIIYEKEAKSFEKFDSDDAQQIRRRYRIVSKNLQLMSTMKHVLNPFVMGFFSIKFWSHKMLRWFAPFFLIALFLTNAFLLKQGVYLKLFFLLQVVFYAIALMYPFLKRVVPIVVLQKLFYAVYFFCFSNLGILIGFFYYFMGRKFKAWAPER